MSNYFKFLPDVYVRTSSYRQNNVDPYTLGKNLFRRIKIKDNLEDSILGFTQYTIPNGLRPDQVALEFYGDMSMDWVVLLTNNIINVYEDWPMEENELYEYLVSTYGSEDAANDIHHWETQRIKDPRGRVVLKDGIQVPENFTYRFADGTLYDKEATVRPVSNYEYHAEINEQKRNIYLLKREYLGAFVEEFESLVQYLPNQETEEFEQIKLSRDTVQEQFINVKPTYSTNIGQTSSIEFAAQEDYSSRIFDTNGDTIQEGDVLADGSTVAVTTAGQVDNTTSQNAFGSSGY